jgi:outer membrane murein-binding lipoprotein Lpp
MVAIGFGTLFLAAGCAQQPDETAAAVSSHSMNEASMSHDMQAMHDASDAHHDHATRAAEAANVTSETKGTQTTCPVMKGNPVNRSLYVDHDGKRIYVCCGYCIGEIKKDPDAYIRQLEDAGVTLERVPAKAAM